MKWMAVVGGITLIGAVGYLVTGIRRAPSKAVSASRAEEPRENPIASGSRATPPSPSWSHGESSKTISMPLLKDGQQPIPPEARDPHLGRVAAIAQLRATGAGASAPRVVEAYNTMQDLERELAKLDGVRMENVECYQGGCVSNLSFTDESLFHKNQMTIFHQARAHWSGPTFISGADNDNGRTLASLILFTPSANQQ